ncbi:MAG: hypothetical protein MHM6MM_002651 [Cercozoa sp. M6MM]
MQALPLVTPECPEQHTILQAELAGTVVSVQEYSQLLRQLRIICGKEGTPVEFSRTLFQRLNSSINNGVDVLRVETAAGSDSSEHSRLLLFSRPQQPKQTTSLVRRCTSSFVSLPHATVTTLLGFTASKNLRMHGMRNMRLQECPLACLKSLHKLL